MSAKTSIEWTDRSWNPIRGCQLESPGCSNCYAMKQAHRFSGPGKAYEGLTKIGGKGPIWTGAIRLVESALTEPLTWREPQRVFVNSMSDLFHKDVPDAFIDRVFAVMMACGILENRRHTFQILTKRAERMRDYLTSREPADLIRAWAEAGNGLVTLADEDTVFSELVMSQTAYDWDEKGTNSSGSEYRPWSYLKNLWPLPNVWLGVSCENQEWADKRVRFLLQTPARVRFLSCEPLLGLIDLTAWLTEDAPKAYQMLSKHYGVNGFDATGSQPIKDRKIAADIGLHWVICGGESGPSARPMHPNWAKSLRDQCQAAGVAFHFKQHGEWVMSDQVDSELLKSVPEGSIGPSRSRWMTADGKTSKLGDGHCPPGPERLLLKLGKKASGRLLDGRTWDQMPEVNQ